MCGACGLSISSNITHKLSVMAEHERNPTPMSPSIHFLGLDVHKESVAVSIAPSDSTEVRHYGNIGGASTTWIG